jgi:hypothetical protein
MKKRAISESILAALCFISGTWIFGESLRQELYGMAIGFALAILVELVLYLYEYRRFLLLFLKCSFSSKELRLTISYLYNIEVNGKYLLVKSHRLQDTYQPVGGVYKYFNPDGKSQLDKLGIITDNFIDNDEVSEFDLRVKMRNRNKMQGFIDWFFRRENREIDPWREFYEELVESGILPLNIFGYIHYELIGQHFEDIHYDPFFRIDTFKYADIFKPKYVNNDQEKAVRNLSLYQSNDYIWATEQEIMQERSNDGKRIAEHTKKIFQTRKLK